jgi:hypothetical protein
MYTVWVSGWWRNMPDIYGMQGISHRCINTVSMRILLLAFYFLFVYKENSLYGYMDSEGHIIIPPRFYNAGNFNEGLAPVREGHPFGYLDSTGVFQIPPTFGYAEEFAHGMARVNVKHKKL